MPPLSTLNSAALRRMMTRCRAEISFVLQRDQLLHEPLCGLGTLGGEALKLDGSVDTCSQITIFPGPIVRKDAHRMWFEQDSLSEGKLKWPFGWDH